MANVLNQLIATSVRRVTPWRGVWIADVDVNLDATGMPSGPAVLTIGSSIIRGTIDPRPSGKFAEHARIRIVGGAGGWDKTVDARHFHNDGQVLSSAVFTSTGAEVGESVVDLAPTPLGVDYVRSAGPASRVLAGVDWFITPEGVTTIGPRVAVPFDPASVEILSWDPLTRVAELATDVPIEPGTILVDPTRFAGTLTVRDVEQTWGADGARATVWCAESKGSRLQDAITSLVVEKAGIVYLKTYRYRVVSENVDGRLVLQAVAPRAGMPDALPISVWFGIPGLSAMLEPGSIVLVEFTEGDPTQPVVRAFEGGTVPLKLNLDVGVALSVNKGIRPVAALGDFAGPFPIAATGLNLMVP